MSKLLLLPEPLLKSILNEFGNPTGNNWFVSVGESIDYYYKIHRSSEFSYLKPPHKLGTSLDALKRSLGYNSETHELVSGIATGTNLYIREVLSKKYGQGLNWTQYLQSIHLFERDLLPTVSNKSRLKQHEGQIKGVYKTDGTHIEVKAILSATCSSLAGYWLSRFEYVSKSGNRNELTQKGYQIDVERIDNCGSKSLSGLNLAIISPSGKKYEHELIVQLFGDFLVGYWKNVNTKNIGAFQLFVNTNMCVMTGMHLGNANDNTIQSGVWIWIKIIDDVSTRTDQLIRSSRLKDPGELTQLITQWKDIGNPIRLTDIFLI